MFDEPDVSEDIQKLLDTYSFQDILDYNDLTEEEVIALLFLSGHIELPDIKPLK